MHWSRGLIRALPQKPAKCTFIRKKTPVGWWDLPEIPSCYSTAARRHTPEAADVVLTLWLGLRRLSETPLIETSGVPEGVSAQKNLSIGGGILRPTCTYSIPASPRTLLHAQTDQQKKRTLNAGDNEC